MLAALMMGPMLMLPGLAIARIAGLLPECRRDDTPMVLAVVLVAACGVLPLLDSLAARLVGLGPALAIHLVLCGIGLKVPLGLPLERLPRSWLAALGLWLAVVVFAWIDFDTPGGLNQSLLIKDMIKHAATVGSMVDRGAAPPADVFFLRDQPAGYYYYFYVLPALVEFAACGLIDSRAAVGGQVFWTGLAFFSLALVLVDRLCGGRARTTNSAPVIAVLMAASGLEILLVLLVGSGTGVWFAQVGWWKEAIGGFVHSVLWVPHHVDAVIATWAGLLTLVGAIGRRSVSPLYNGSTIAVAGAAFASALGLSVWVTLGAVAIVGCWMAALALERRWPAIGLVAAAGAVSVLLSAPHLADLLANRAYDGFPIALSLRATPFDSEVVDPTAMQNGLRLAWLPVNLLLGFGVLLIGSLVYWRLALRRDRPADDVARLIALSALCGLAISSVCKSTIVNNDLGWRVLLFVQVAALVWTASVMPPLLRLWRQRRSRRTASPPRLAPAMLAMLSIGLVGTAYEVTALRASDLLGLAAFERVAGHEAIDGETRAAYEWAKRNVASGAVLQHNPDMTYMLGFGLYSRRPVAVAPRNLGTLFGASRTEVEQRLADIGPVFAGGLTAADARERLVRNRVDLVMVTTADAVWRESQSWVWRSRAAYASERVRIVAVDALIQ
ncbi:MAG: hypothetical protein ACT4N2_02880 [Hyphomicrobium sp.]